MTPTYRMPNPQRLYDEATAADLRNALSAARCSAELAGMQTDEFVVRELLLTVIQQIDRATAAAVTGRLLPPS